MIVFGPWPSGALSADAPAWLRVGQEGPVAHVEAVCGGLDDEHVRYELVTRKSGPSGQSKSVQSGDAFVAAGEEKTIARSATRLGPEDLLLVELRVSRRERPIFEVAAQVGGRAPP